VTSAVDVDRSGLEVLGRAECLRLLAQTDRGRIAINVRALPAILPVRYALDGEQVVVCTDPETVLARATDGHVVAFEAESAEPPEWSVSVVGVARHVTDPQEEARLGRLPLPRWRPGAHARFVTISTEEISGRRNA
jgi:nitroimidazol reductase NimA-like FMN-containing flavoprotein (pyridoxamine 5'-phosphate oxidase superfamily)